MQYIISLFLILATPQAFAEKPLSNSEIQRIMGSFQKVQSLEAHFQQTKMLKRFKTELKSQGQIAFQRKKDLPYVRWEVTQPSPAKMEIQGEYILLTELQFGRSSVKKIPLKEGGKDLMALISWLTLDVPSLQKEYTIYGSEKALKLYPKNSSLQIEKIKLSQPAEGFFQSVQIFDKNNDFTTIQFSKIKTQP